MLGGFGWSSVFLLVTRLSAVAAVPIVLHGLTPDLYAVWVIAGALVMIQSLFDLGVASAVVRYVATAAAGSEGGRSAIVLLARRAMTFYTLLSLAVFLPLWFGASEIAGVMHVLKHAEVAQAVVIIRWAAIAFVLTNVALVAAAILQGIDRVAASYRDQTLGWLLYLPLLLIGMRLVSNAQAVGLAWVGAYAVQTMLLTRSLVLGIRAVPDGPARAPGLAEMLSFGGQWQLSAWADFATFQLPRFLAGAALSSGDVVTIDIAIRAAQFAVAPLFAFYPVVLPRAAALLAHSGLPALRSFVQQYYASGILLVLLSVCVLLPVEVPVLAVWTGRPASSFSPVVAAAVLIGTVAHASTGLLSSVLLARGDVRPVMRYKGRQLALAAILLAVAAPLGVVPVSLAISVSLLVPALAFNVVTARRLGVNGPVTRGGIRRRMSTFAVAQIALPMTIVVTARSALGSWQLLGLVLLADISCLVAAGSLLLGRPVLRLYGFGPDKSPDALPPLRVGDHLAKK
jgi:O-antigen/teichoic acid export membrane protein